MSELLDMVLRAQGGLDRWSTFKRVTATIVSGGGLLPMKGIKVDPQALEGIATIHHESTVIRPFGLPDWQMVFTPEQVVIETTTGNVVQERSDPRSAFAGHTLTSAWDVLHRAYFNGYARWTYLHLDRIRQGHPGKSQTRTIRAGYCSKRVTHYS